jgi:cytochrome b subunit of formate dehydrogenase
MRRSKKPQTDIGTVFLHWWLAGSLIISTLSGLRFAVDMPDTAYIDVIEPLLLAKNIWIIHIFAGVSVMALATAYPLYLGGTGLVRRIWPDRTRIIALRTPGKARWGAVNVFLYWLLFACLVGQLVTGIMLYRGYGGSIVDIHLFVTWLIVAYAVVHIVAHLAFGGVAQLMRVFRPTRVPTAPPTMMMPADGSSAMPKKSGRLTGTRTLAGSVLAGIAVGATFLCYDRMSRDVLHVVRIPETAAWELKADLSGPIWRNAPILSIHTNQGTNFNGTGASLVEVQAVHDDKAVYFAFTWDDPTRSLKHAPLIKERDGWHALFKETPKQYAASLAAKTRFAKATLTNFEDALAEDKFAIMLANVEKPFGPGAFHPGAKPLANMPPSSSGRGLHYTLDGSRVNLWLWHADGSLSYRCENNRIGPPAKPTSAQTRGLTPYEGGYIADPAEATMFENFSPTLPRDPAVTVVPLRLPKDLKATRAAMGVIDLDPDHGDSEDAKWWMTEENSRPYTASLDAQTPLGSIIPGVIAAGRRKPSAADIRCIARWTAGRWTLLTSRRFHTGRGDDVQIGNNTYMWVAAFDHTVANHTRHIRPFKLEIEQ